MSTNSYNLPTITLEAHEKFRVIQVPKDLTKDERMSVIAAAISTLHATPPDQRQLVELVYNLLILGIPEMATVTNSFTSVSYEQVSPTRMQLLVWVGLEPGTDGAASLLLPELPGEVREEAYAVTKELGVYIALSSLLFSLGKQATESSKASVLDNRPDALIRRFDLSEEDQILLPGRESGPSRKTMETIYNAFANYTEIRAAITLFFLALRRQRQHLPLHLEVMMTNFQLMRGAGMTHVDAVLKLVRMHPWVLRVPKLEPFFEKFIVDLEKFNAIEADIRPYHRLLVPQIEYLFLSSELQPIIAVAGAFIEEVEASFSGYVYNKAKYQNLINEVKSYVPNYNPSAGLTRMADLLGVRDEPLPKRAQKEGASTAATV